MTDIRYGEWGHFESQKDSATLYEWQGHRGVILDTVGNYTILHCFGCLLNHCVPIPSETWLEDYYRERFYQAHPDYVARYEEDRTWWEMWHQITVNQALMLLRGSDAHDDEEKWDKPLACLDIGAGPGIFLDIARRSGFSTYGIEPSMNLTEMVRGRGHAVACGTLSAYLETGLHPVFDLIHAYEVLEHVPQPDVFLEQCYEMLKPEGVIAITVPNDYSTLQMAACEQFKLNRWWVAPPEHLNYFSPKTLQLLIRRSGFTILELRGTFPLETFLFMGRPYVGDDEIGRVCHHERVRYEINMAEAGLINWVIDQYRYNVEHSYSRAIGREIVVIAQKE